MLISVLKSTKDFIAKMKKTDRKKYGQFFTDPACAEYMASLFNIDSKKESIELLDPGAGSGLLSVAFLESLQGKFWGIVHLTCYENDQNILPLLKKNLEIAKSQLTIHFDFNIIDENFILSQKEAFSLKKPDKMFDYIICNPPYLKIGKEAPEALVVPEINYGAPNLYSIFASLCFFDLKTNGQLVLIFPRSWTSGAYFEHFRSYLFSCGCIRKLHLFISRSEVFNDETVLQETMIMRFDKTLDENSTINISSTSSSKDFTNIQSINVPSSLVVHGAKHFVFLLTSPEDIEVFLRINKFTNTLLTDGLKMKTGIVVDFRTKEVLHCDYEKGLLPLFYPQHMKNGKIIFPLKNGTYEYIDNSRKCLLQSNKNYLFVKRFTSKEESRRLQCAIYSKEDFPQYPSISTQNKINFIEKIDGSELNLDIIYGLFVIFNSSDYDSYYRILNGSTQVNSTEINALPMPSISQIELIGKECRKQKKNCTQACDKIMEELLWQRS